MNLTVAQVLSLAPDASAAAAEKLASAKILQNLGQSVTALWGECQAALSIKSKLISDNSHHNCTMPKPQASCKHVSGLLLLAAESPAACSNEFVAEWGDEWLAKPSGPRRTAREEIDRKRNPWTPRRRTSVPTASSGACRRSELLDSGSTTWCATG